METEYGIDPRGMGEKNPIAASSVLINAYVAELTRRVGWDFEDESPGNDARGFAREGSMPPEVETHLVNAVLTNGARYYVDHAHPEFSTPECSDALEVVRFDKAGARIVQHVIPHFVTRQIYTGAGKVGTEASSTGGLDVTYQLTQRADFFEEEVGLETTLKRPIVNTRDEPHADAQKYRRLHVIVGDANLAEVSTFLKLGVTALVLAMIEDDWFGERDFTLATPVAAMRKVSYDLSLEEPLQLVDGSTMTALQLQWEYFNLAQKYVDAHGFESVGEIVGPMVLDRWERVLSGLEHDPMSLADQLDWVAKYRLLDGYRERHGLAWTDHKLAAMDLQYHHLRPDRSLFARVGTERLVTESEVAEAVTAPPRDTRAYFRGKCLQRWASSIAAANWDSMVFDLGTDPLRRVPMMEPLRGTAAHVDRLLEGCSSPAELLERLGS